VTLHDGLNDQSLAAIAELRGYDVSRRRAARLRTRCHAVLQAQSRRNVRAGIKSGTLFRRIIGPALAGAWCLAYLMEIIRRAAAVYGF
jgi:hypothetical protein